jgi:hypothetical protein
LAEKAHDSFDYLKVDLEGFDSVWWRAGGVLDFQVGREKHEDNFPYVS